MCETNLSPPPPGPGSGALTAENPECEPLRQKIRRLSRKIKRTDDPERKATLKQKRRKARKRLAALGCSF